MLQTCQGVLRDPTSDPLQRAFGETVWTRGLSLRVGALNILNRQPPFALVGGAQGYDPTEGDLRERFVYGMFQKTF